MKKIVLISIIGFFLALGVGSAQAEIITFVHPLIYCPQKTGPATYEVEEGVVTEGTITSMTANWEFKGEVTLELSANNGLDYTPVINGLPLTRGFIRGNQLKFRAHLGEGSYLNQVKIVYTDTSGVSATFGTAQLSGFKYRRSLYIRNPGQKDLFNYQIKVEVDEKQISTEADFKDVYFTAPDKETLLSFYRESVNGKQPNRQATFWVKVPQIPKTGIRIYLYYGNPKAADLSSGEATFDFFDNFDRRSLDSEKWQVDTGLTGYYSLVNSQLKLRQASVFSRAFKIKTGIIEYRARTEENGSIQALLGENKEIYSSAHSGAEHAIAVDGLVKANVGLGIKPDTYYLYRIICDGKYITFERLGTVPERGLSLQASINLFDIDRRKLKGLGLKAGEATATYFDWIRVRKYGPSVFSNQPSAISVQFSAEEEKVNLARFGKDEYESQVIPSAFEVRILKVEGASVVKVSTDGGKTYQRLKEKKFYYASKGDFKPGRELRFSIQPSAISHGPNLTNEPRSFCQVRAGLKRQPSLTLQNERRSICQVSEERLTIDYRPGMLTLFKPNGGEVYKAGHLTEILWSATDYELNYPLKLEYSADKGRIYKTIASTTNTGSFYWRIPEGLDSQEVLIKISDYYAPEVYDTSDRVFSIQRSAISSR
jgi:hypothetical protein